MNQRKDGGVGSDTESQSEHGGSREAFALQELPEGEAKIFDHNTSNTAEWGEGYAIHRIRAFGYPLAG
jgi:hypothetical protein